MNNKRTFFIALTLLATTLACAIPAIPVGQTAPPNPPTVDTGILSTMVAKTVAAAVALTEQAVPIATLPPTQTETPTLSPTPEVGAFGTILRIQEDGSAFFLDQRAGFEITVPAGWLTVRPNEQEYQNAFLLPETADEHIQKSLTSLQNQDPNKFRLLSIDTRDGHIQDEFVTNINFGWDEQNTISLDTDEELKEVANQTIEALPGLEILSTTISNTAIDVQYGSIESKLAAKNSSGVDIVIFQKQIIFNAKTGLVIITLSTVESLKDTISPEFDGMIETIRISTD